ncbi:MAG: MFS transporter [Acidobacteriota bacterium]|nr:MFS transporter [Acidobacteriota bacterium]
MPRSTTDVRVTLAVYYASHFGHLGMVLPFLPPWLLSLGLAPASIGFLLALVPLSKLAAPWIWGGLADRSGRRRGLLVVSTAAAAVAFYALGGQRNLAALVVVMGVYAVCFAPGIPFIEATALEQAEARRFAYGKTRLWGSLAFAAVSAAYGIVADHLTTSVFFPMGAAVLAFGAVAAFFLPASHRAGEHEVRAPGADLGATAPSEPRFGTIRLLLACALMQASHGAYYTFYSIHLDELGYSSTAVGLFWAFAVVCEVLLLMRIDGVVDRLGTGATLRISLVAAAVRWVVIGSVSDPLWLGLAQSLHALTYAAFHVAALREVYRRFGAANRTKGQTIYSGATYGLGFFVGTLGAGILAELIGLGDLYRVSAVVALAGLVVMGTTR